MTFQRAFSFLATADAIQAGTACRIFHRWCVPTIDSISFSLARVTDEYLAAMGGSGALTALRSVTFTRCVMLSVAGVSAFCAGHPSLTSVIFELSSTDLASARTVLAQCPALKTLGLRYNDTVGGSAADLRAFATACSGLHTLSLRGSRMMKHLNRQGLFFQRGSFASLTSLDLAVLPHVTRETLYAISAACPVLTILSLERSSYPGLHCHPTNPHLGSVARGSLFGPLVR